VIVRIFSEGQYRLDELDNASHKAIEAGDERAFEKAFRELLDYVRSHGALLAEDELEGSDLMLPPPDISLDEARVEFTGEGLIPD
jgi:hypothetical protein